uniref:Inositol polyphosphate-related phosphatase domain-containing protein n=1 Tax=Cucumis melo TaxID=3656 RepID=A0A9I9DKQ3_CUCME
MTLRKQDSRKKSFIRKMFAMGERNGKKEFKGSFVESTDPNSDLQLDSTFLGSTDSLMAPGQEVQSFRVFVATWNVGGKSPPTNLNLNDFLKNDNCADIYIFGFQEIVPLNAGNVLVIEDNEPAARWLSLINQSLNNPTNGCSRGPKSNTSLGGSKFFPKPSLKSISKTFRTVSRRKLKSCNCTPLELERKRSKDFWFRCQPSNVSQSGISSEEDDDEEDPSIFDISDISIPESSNETKYGLIASKQMVGIFVTIWMRQELVPHVSHLRISSTGRGIMGCLGNKFTCLHLWDNSAKYPSYFHFEIVRVGSCLPGVHFSEHVISPDKLLLHLQPLSFWRERRR